MIGPFRRRSSWPSSLVTGLIGWLGVAVLGALAAGWRGLGPLLAAGAIAAVVQVVVLRLASVGRGVPYGVGLGAVTGAALGAGAPLAFALPPLAACAGAGAFIGANVGLYLAYFARDDRKIEEEARARGGPVDYGRDAHWLDPFAYGAAAYLLAFLPRSVELAGAAVAVGAMVGVAAAATSHFVLSMAGSAAWTIPVAALAGAVAGAASGWLFRGFELPAPWAAHGAAAGALAFGVTAAVGRVLARREAE
jgi:hypothetical protein